MCSASKRIIILKEKITQCSIGSTFYLINNIKKNKIKNHAWDHLLKSIEQYKVLQNTFNFDSLLWKVKLFIFCGDNTTVRNPADFLSVSRDHRTGRGSSGIRSTFFEYFRRGWVCDDSYKIKLYVCDFFWKISQI